MSEALTAVTVGVVAALPAEGKALAGGRVRLGETHLVNEHVAVRVSGVGPSAARRASEALIAQGVGALISWGIAAGLDAALVAGTIVLADRVVTEEDAPPVRGGSQRAAVEFRSVASWADHLAADLKGVGDGHLRLVRGTIGCPARVLRSVDDKISWGRATGAMAADMESAAVAAVASREEVPWIAVRAIADVSSLTVPVSALEGIDPSGEFTWLRFLTSLARHPGDIRELPRLARAYRAALRSLELVAPSAGRAFHAPRRVGAYYADASERGS